MLATAVAPLKPLLHISSYAMKHIGRTALVVAFMLPGTVFAQAEYAANLAYLDTLVVSLGDLVAQLVPVVIALGLLAFIWGLVSFIFSSGDEEAAATGKRRMIWGVFALFVIVSVWGLVALLNQITGIEQGVGFDMPGTGL